MQRSYWSTHRKVEPGIRFSQFHYEMLWRAVDLLVGGAFRFTKPSKFTNRLQFRALLHVGSLRGGQWRR